jgi:hypothetical protein
MKNGANSLAMILKMNTLECQFLGSKILYSRKQKEKAMRVVHLTLCEGGLHSQADHRSKPAARERLFTTSWHRKRRSVSRNVERVSYWPAARRTARNTQRILLLSDESRLSYASAVPEQLALHLFEKKTNSHSSN